MAVIRSTETRRSETGAGVMTTFASPTLGGAGSAVWRVEVGADVAGPLHVFDAEQVWVFVEGGATIELGDQTVSVTAGDTVIMPAGTPRKVAGDPTLGFSAIVTAPAGAKAGVPGGATGATPPWIQ
ncbi:cupin domain-containing protein [Nocardia sp. NPDC020380]|uniref:cupin domain-containing protein n=1 Tax=Nocardia sp. NPDC020380 TaxID=3364309 RepID=UPI0037B95337